MRVLVASWLGSTNLGDELLFQQLARLLREAGHDVVAPSSEPEGTARTHSVEAITNNPATLARAARTCHAVLVGGGDLWQDVTSPLSLPFHLSRVVAARASGPLLGAVGLGVPAWTRRGSRTLVRSVWPKDAPVAVRDRASLDVVARAGIRATLAADLALLAPRPNVSPRDEIAVCLRAWDGGGLLPVAARRRTTDTHVIEAYGSALDSLVRTTGLPVKFVALQPDRDGPWHEAIGARMPSGSWRSVRPNLASLLEEVCSTRLVVAVRYHGAIAGVVGDVPVVALRYADKVASLAAEAPTAVRGLNHDLASLSALPDLAVDLLGDPDRMAQDERDRLRSRARVNLDVLRALGLTA